MTEKLLTLALTEVVCSNGVTSLQPARKPRIPRRCTRAKKTRPRYHQKERSTSVKVHSERRRTRRCVFSPALFQIRQAVVPELRISTHWCSALTALTFSGTLDIGAGSDMRKIHPLPVNSKIHNTARTNLARGLPHISKAFYKFSHKSSSSLK